MAKKELVERLRVILVVLFFLAGVFTLAPEASAKETTIVILHDVPDDGYTYVGNPVHFGYVILTDGQTSRHQDGYIRVTQNNVTLYETNAKASHDYNGLNTFVVAFPAVGPYEVYAEIPDGGPVPTRANFTGFVMPNNNTRMLHLDVDSSLSQGVGSFTIALNDHTGALLNHSDALFEVRRPGDDWLLFRTHLHTHTEPMALSYRFQEPGEYLIRVVGYNAFPTPDGDHYAPAATTLTVDVPAAAPDAGASSVSLPAPKGTNPFTLLTAIDPQRTAQPGSRFIPSVLVQDPTTGAFVPHVNFEALLTDAAGRLLFHSASLHEYDGHFDLVYETTLPGTYLLQVNVERGDWIARSEIPFIVAEAVPHDDRVPVGPEPGGTPLLTSAGAVVVTAEGLTGLKSGLASHLTFHARNVAGVAAQHTEIDYQVLRTEWGAPVLQNKIHTHGTGDFEVEVNFPDPGEYVLVLDPVTIHGEPVKDFYFGEVGGSLVVPLTVGMGAVFPSFQPPEIDAPAEPAEVLPGFEPFVALLAAFGVLVIARRRA